MLQTMHSNWSVISHACKWSGTAKSVYVLPDPWSSMIWIHLQLMPRVKYKTSDCHSTLWLGWVFQNVPRHSDPILFHVDTCLRLNQTHKIMGCKNRDLNWWASPIDKSPKCFLSNVVSPEVSELPVAFRINSACSARLLLEACKVDIWKRFPLSMNWMHSECPFSLNIVHLQRRKPQILKPSTKQSLVHFP